ncbi:MAG: hypothetical protein Ct9H90mP6_06300 [Gammaproteobacteria bacterium]|nr:MAG: hypothetical protein Ct9H90mP6_06300 [Gammaproteobacteria bacterium]
MLLYSRKPKSFLFGRTFLEPNIKAAINERFSIAGIKGIYSDAPGRKIDRNLRFFRGKQLKFHHG